MRHAARWWAVAVAGVGIAAPVAAQAPHDTTLVRQVLEAEDRGDATDPALVRAAAHPDTLVRLLARRAMARISDSLFGARATFPSPEAPPRHPDPAWRIRHRALGTRGVTCATMHAGLADSAWPVRFRATVALTAPCTDIATLTTLTGWADGLPAGVAPRPAGGVSWHAAVHALVALARLAPDEARRRLPAFEAHPAWQVRQHAVRAAGALGDSVHLRAAMADTHPNVRAAAIAALAGSANPLDRGRLVDALRRTDVPTVLAAARALADAPEAAAREAATAALARWLAHGNASERDVRVALLAVTGRPASDDRPPPRTVRVTPDAVALAMGAERWVRVTMAPASGGGTFTVRFRGDVAPIMGGQVLALVRNGYYDGTTWHRVEHDFVIQGGSPGADEYVGLDRYLRDELGTVPHVRGTVGMSTRGHDTGDAQWFVNLRDNLRLNRDYTVFGEVVEGIDVVDGILEGDVIASMRVVPGP